MKDGTACNDEAIMLLVCSLPEGSSRMQLYREDTGGEGNAHTEFRVAVLGIALLPLLLLLLQNVTESLW